MYVNKVVLIFFLALQLSGCHTVNKYVDKYVLGKTSTHEDGLNYLNAGAYDQAVEKLVQAQAQDPQNPQIPVDLAKARELAAKDHFKLGSGLSAKNEINGALTEFDTARSYQPNNATYSDRYNQEKEKYDRLHNKIKNIGANAGGETELKQSLTELKSIRTYESSFPEIGEKIETIKNKVSGHHERLYEKKIAMQDFDGAFAEIEKAVEYSDEERLQNKKRALHHLRLSDSAWKRKSYMQAYEEIAKALEFDPDSAQIKKYETSLINQWAGVLYNEAVQASNDGRYGDAKSKLTSLSRIKPGYLNTEELLLEYGATLSANYYDKAESFMNSEDRSQAGLAVANYLLVKEQHSNQHPDLESKIAEAKRRLKSEVEYRISVDFKNESTEPGAGMNVKNQVLDRLKTSKSFKNIKIFERENLNEIMQEQALGQGFLDESTSLPVKKIKGIQAALKGTVIKVEVKETGRDRPTYGSSRYKSGTKWMPNQEYTRLEREASNARQRVSTAQQKANDAKLEQKRQEANRSPLPNYQTGNKANDVNAGLQIFTDSLSTIATASTSREATKRLNNARSELDGLDSKLAQTPRQIEEDVMEDFRYKILDLKLEGEVILSFKVVNYTTSEVGNVRTVRMTDEVADRFIPGDPGKGVEADPNNLPTIKDFKNKLLMKAIDKIVEGMEKELPSHSYGYYEKAEDAARDQMVDDATENYMRFLYSTSNLRSKEARRANDYIYEKMGLRILRRKK